MHLKGLRERRGGIAALIGISGGGALQFSQVMSKA